MKIVRNYLYEITFSLFLLLSTVFMMSVIALAPAVTAFVFILLTLFYIYKHEYLLGLLSVISFTVGQMSLYFFPLIPDSYVVIASIIALFCIGGIHLYFRYKEHALKESTFSEPARQFVITINNQQYYWVGTIDMVNELRRSVKILDRHIVFYKEAVFIVAHAHENNENVHDVVIRSKDIYISLNPRNYD